MSCNHLYAYFTANKLFYEGQYGIREKNIHSISYNGIVRYSTLCSKWQKASGINIHGSKYGLGHFRAHKFIKWITMLWHKLNTTVLVYELSVQQDTLCWNKSCHIFKISHQYWASIRRLISIGIPIINLRRSSDRLRFIMGILSV